MVSSIRENCICSRFPYYMEPMVFEKMVDSAEVLNQLVRRIIEEIVCHGKRNLFQYGNFPLLKNVLSNTAPLPPFFWVRFDAFQREDGGIFFSEFNYDKPCAQRETLMSTMDIRENAPSMEFADKFREGMKQIWEEHGAHKGLPTIALVVDPAHYEEVHLGFLFMDLLKPLGYEVIIVGGKNLTVEKDRVLAFGKTVDILLRQYPTEFMEEIPCAGDVLRLYEEGKVLLLNDCRVILGQTKSLFAFLWQLVEENSDFLTMVERQVIRETIPHTTVFDEKWIPEIEEHKEHYVIKAAYGRYSEEVYIGNMYDEEEWKELLEYVKQSERLHIIQEFCPIRRERVLRFNGADYQDEDAFGNFGIYLVNEKFAGISVRWSTDYLSHDETVWTSGIGIGKRKLKIASFINKDYRKTWGDINHIAAFEYGYTGGYTGSQKSFSLQPMVLDHETFDELQFATEALGQIVKRTVRFVQDNYKLFCPVLGIDDNLAELVSRKDTDSLAFIGRFDWVMSSEGALKLLEFNAETPAGLMESLVLADLIQKELNLPYRNPNDEFGRRILDSFIHIVNQYSNLHPVKNIGLVSTAYYEDWYNTTILYDILRVLPYNLVLGEVSSLKAENGKLYLENIPLDAVYRYYPLDWFAADLKFQDVLSSLGQKTLSINPPSTLISQSKAFWALVWDLVTNGFYTTQEETILRKYVPQTALSPKKIGSGEFCIKPGLGREGQQVAFSFNQTEHLKYLEAVYQEWIDVQPVRLSIYTTRENKNRTVYPVIGTYMTGDRFAGIYTRAGGRITDKWAIYVPTYIEK